MGEGYFGILELVCFVYKCAYPTITILIQEHRMRPECLTKIKQNISGQNYSSYRLFIFIRGRNILLSREQPET